MVVTHAPSREDLLVVLLVLKEVGRIEEVFVAVVFENERVIGRKERALFENVFVGHFSPSTLARLFS